MQDPSRATSWLYFPGPPHPCKSTSAQSPGEPLFAILDSSRVSLQLGLVPPVHMTCHPLYKPQVAHL